MIGVTIAKKYAKALLGMGLQDGNYEVLGQDLEKMADLLGENKELRVVLWVPHFRSPPVRRSPERSVKGSALPRRPLRSSSF